MYRRSLQHNCFTLLDLPAFKCCSKSLSLTPATWLTARSSLQFQIFPYLVTYWSWSADCGRRCWPVLVGDGAMGLWAIVLPVAYLPLLLSLLLNGRKAKKLGYTPVSALKGQTWRKSLQSLWYDLDFFGLLLLTAAECLILIPLTIASTASGGWGNRSIIAMLVVGGVSLVAFIFWERSKKLAPKAFFPPELFRSRTVITGGHHRLLLLHGLLPFGSALLLLIPAGSRQPGRYISSSHHQCLPLLVLCVCCPDWCRDKVC